MPKLAAALVFSDGTSLSSAPKVQEVPFSFVAAGFDYYTATVACTLAAPTTRGSATFTYTYSALGTTFVAATFPLLMAAGGTLRVQAATVVTYASATFQRT